MSKPTTERFNPSEPVQWFNELPQERRTAITTEATRLSQQTGKELGPAQRQILNREYNAYLSGGAK